MCSSKGGRHDRGGGLACAFDSPHGGGCGGRRRLPLGGVVYAHRRRQGKVGHDMVLVVGGGNHHW
jgi:hypothetical protein